MQNGEVVASIVEFGDQGRTDEAVATDEEDLHAGTPGEDARRSISIKKTTALIPSHP